MGQVLLGGAGQMTARQAAVKAGIPLTVPATTVNKVCLSGLNAIHLADLIIQAGEADIVVAGGMESMTNAPYLLPKARAGYRIGDGAVVDSMMYDGLFCAIDQVAMGAGTEKYARTAEILRDPQDELAYMSHDRAAKAQKNGLFDDEIVKVEIPQRKGDPILFSDDEGVRGDTTLESLAALRPAFDKAGNITAGNASQISDGGSAVIVCSEAAAEKLGVDPLGRIVGYGQVAGPDPSLLHQPADAIKQALDRAGLSVGDLDLFELNEAFAAVGVASMDRARHHRRDHQRQRWRHRPRPPDRHVRHPRRPAPAPRAEAPWRRQGRRGPLRRRRSGRRHHPRDHLSRRLRPPAHPDRHRCAAPGPRGRVRRTVSRPAAAQSTLAAALEGPAEGELVGVLEVAADGEAAGDAGDLEPERLEQPAEVHRGGLALDVGVGAEDDLLDALGVEAGEQLLDPQLVGPDALDGADGALEHVVATLELAGLLDGDDVAGLLDHADDACSRGVSRSRSRTGRPRRC